MKKFLCGAAVLSASLMLASSVYAADVMVSAAASLKEAFNAVKVEFEKANPGTNVLLSFAGSNTCLRQIQSGAPADVFASADQETMDKAQNAKLTDASTRVDFARNDLVLIVPADSPLKASKFASAVKKLGKSSVKKIAVGNIESVPAGRYTKDALASLGAWDSLQSKYIFGQNVRQVLSYTSQGEVDAGFVYRTDALKGGDKVRVLATATGHKPILYPIAVCNTGKNASAGKAFVKFVASKKGQKILSDFGFSRP